MLRVDAIVIGAGAAGLFCAGRAGQRGLRVLVLDHAERVAEKVRISGGGRCNFTNLQTGPGQFLSDNPAFCRSALARYTPQDFLDLMRRHGLGWHEKHKGQLFCDEGSEAIVRLLLAECEAGGVQRWQPCAVQAVARQADGFVVTTARGPVQAPQLVVATGGLSIPKIGASDFGHRLAQQFGHPVVAPRPALVPLVFEPSTWAPWVPLAGVALPVEVATGSGKAAARFQDDLLFTHRGLSGPALLQISSFWRPGQALQIKLLPGLDLDQALRQAKNGGRRNLANTLAHWLPQRLAEHWPAQCGLAPQRPLAEARDRDLARLAQAVQAWTLAPSGTEGWRKAEVTAGGVDTRSLDSRHMASRSVPGLHFIGEVVDVTGWLGGYNFQWAWASAAACADALQPRTD